LTRREKQTHDAPGMVSEGPISHVHGERPKLFHKKKRKHLAWKGRRIRLRTVKSRCSHGGKIFGSLLLRKKAKIQQQLREEKRRRISVDALLEKRRSQRFIEKENSKQFVCDARGEKEGGGVSAVVEKKRWH